MWLTFRESLCAIASVQPYLSEAFLDRVKAAYRRALSASPAARGQWAGHNERRADVHAALLTGDNEALRTIFFDPTTTDLYYGVDDLCRSVTKLKDPSDFIRMALRHDRARIATYQITRLQELIPGARRVVEIGPGMGRAAYYGFLAGLDYTTIDLPLGIVAQACFLGRAIGPGSLWFAGEDETSSVGKLRLLHSTPDQRFDVALNVDSITEMPAAVAFAYFRWCGKHADCLFSINHNKNRFTADQLATFAGPMRVVVRRPCPAWDGYTEQSFLPKKRDLFPGRLRLAAFQALIMVHRVKRRSMGVF